MTAWLECKTMSYPFFLAALVWALTTFPCVHLLKLYTFHHMKEVGLHPELVGRYFWSIFSTTLGISFLEVLLVWVLSRRIKSKTRGVVVLGISLGVPLSLVFCAVVNPSFRVVGFYPLDWENFLYSGLLAGIVTGEIRFRSLQRESPVPRSAAELKLDFYLVALMTWAVILKIFECFDLTSVPPGSHVFAPGVHLFMLLSVFLWSPQVCKYLWKYTPGRPIHAILWACAAGVLLPTIIGYVLYLPVSVLLYAGMPLAFAMLWGLRFLDAVGIWRLVLFLVPGLTWGTIVGFFRWRYLQIMRQTQLTTQPSRVIPT